MQLPSRAGTILTISVNQDFERVPFLPWQEMDSLVAEQVAEFQRINSGIHISLVGTTRGGKTTLVTGGGDPERGLLRHFENVLVLDTTGDPGAISDYGKPVRKYGAIRGHQRLTVKGQMNMSTTIPQATKEKVYRYIARAAQQGNVAIYADEVRQLCEKEFFGLRPALTHLWLFGAKQGTSLIGGTQAPVFVPGSFYDQAKLHFLFHVRDVYRLKRLAEIGGATKQLQATIAQLKRWEFAHVGLDGDICVSKFDLKKKVEKEDNQPAERRINFRKERRVVIRRG